MTSTPESQISLCFAPWPAVLNIQAMSDASHAHFPKDGSEMLANNSGIIYCFHLRLSE